jgi:hypothetical protein
MTEFFWERFRRGSVDRFAIRQRLVKHEQLDKRLRSQLHND